MKKKQVLSKPDDIFRDWVSVKSVKIVESEFIKQHSGATYKHAKNASKSNESDIFQLLFTDQMLFRIVEWTNKHVEARESDNSNVSDSSSHQSSSSDQEAGCDSSCEEGSDDSDLIDDDSGDNNEDETWEQLTVEELKKYLACVIVM